jgi:uncharacterized repeat protein (TIGR03803 family)
MICKCQISRLHSICFLLLICVATALTLPGQTFTVLVRQTPAAGYHPGGPLVQGLDGRLYGTLAYGNVAGNCIFRMTRGGALARLVHVPGGSMVAGLTLGAGGKLYGTSMYGGANTGCSRSGYPGCGMVFRATSKGKAAAIYNFCSQPNCTDGAYPNAGLLRGSDGSFYGATLLGGVGNNSGTIFKISPEGALTTLYSFCLQPNCTDGGLPSPLIQATDGNFYGTTPGTVFKITPDGLLTTLYTFCSQPNCTDGSYADYGVVQGADGNFYGVTRSGGANDDGGGPNTAGTVFRLTPAGELTTLYSFCAQPLCADGAGPQSGLIEGTDGNFYGTTFGNTGRSYSKGTIFEVTPDGTLVTLKNFPCNGWYNVGTGCPDGDAPQTALVQDTDGNFYGTTTLGGTSIRQSYGYGTVYRVSMGLPPFVRTLPTSSAAGAIIRILGTNLKGATAVSFNGTAAAFTVISGSQINTTVPAGAVTGKVQVVTPKGTLSSNVPFQVQ